MRAKRINNKNTGFNLIFITAIIGLILLTGLNHSPSSISLIGRVSIALLLIIGFYFLLINLLVKKSILKKEKWLYIYSFLFIAIYWFGNIISLNHNSIIMTAQVSLIILFYLSINNLNLLDKNYRIGFSLITFFIIMNFLGWGVSGFSYPFSGIMNNPNTYGAFIAMSTCLLLFFEKNIVRSRLFSTLFIVTIILSLLLIYSSYSRATWMLVGAFLITKLLWTIISKNKIFFNLYFLLITLFIISITIIYPKLLHTSIGYQLQELSQKYTEKNFFSGRQVIWGQILNKIESKPLLGYGPDAMPSNIIDTNLSAHNFYLQMSLQVGVLGSLLFFLLMLSIWNYFYRARNNNSIKIVGSAFIGILIYQIYEVSLTQNSLALALLQWFIIGLGIMQTRQEKEVPKLFYNT